jgi:hypothetical protein
VGGQRTGAATALDVAAAPPRPPARERAGGFESLLFPHPPEEAPVDGHGATYARDLNLDQVVEAITGDHEEPEFLAGLLYQPVHDLDTVRYRQEVFTDLANESPFAATTLFAERMRQVRGHLTQLPEMRYSYQRQGWFLDAASIYCQAVRRLADDLAGAPLESRAMVAFRGYLSEYVGSEPFTTLSTETAARQRDLGAISYSVRIRGARVEVSRYGGEADYSAEIEATFERFQQGAATDHRVADRGWPGMDHVGAQILDRVARLFDAEFAALGDYCRRHAGFLDETVRRFARELAFYLAYLGYIAPLRAAGLSFCRPRVSGDSKEVFATETFDLALATKLVAARKRVVCNDFGLAGPERIFVVSGPNQGGKTTFARTFGQLHHLAALGCPVPGAAARLAPFDRLFTHFEREERPADPRGKLEDDLVRLRHVLTTASSESIVILNEVFTSTTLADARFLGGKVMDKLAELDALAVYVTFVDELASYGASVVSVLSTVVPQDPATRTYRIVRAPADGLAYALALAEKHGLT